MRHLTIVLLLATLTSCGSNSEKVDYAGCFGNSFCQEQAIKGFESAEEYDVLNDSFNTTLLQPWIAHDNKKYWELLKVAENCGALNNPEYRMHCEYSKLHTAETIDDCMSLSEKEKRIFDYTDASYGTYYYHPQKYCVSMLAASLPTPEKCLADDNFFTQQEYCLEEFAYHQESVGACSLLTIPKSQRKCSQRVKTLIAESYNHCFSDDQNTGAFIRCLEFTYTRARLIGSNPAKKSSVSCQSMPRQYKKACERFNQHHNIVATSDLEKCSESYCRLQTMDYLAFYHKNKFKELSNVSDQCSALKKVSERMPDACIEILSDNLAKMKRDISWCIGENESFSLSCSADILGYTGVNGIDCATAGKKHQGNPKRFAKKNCEAYKRFERAKANEDFTFCGSDSGCKDSVKSFLQQREDYSDETPCETLSNEREEESCRHGLRRLHAKLTGDVSLCPSHYCVANALKRHPSVNCRDIPNTPLQKQCEQKVRFKAERDKLSIADCLDYNDVQECITKIFDHHSEQRNTATLNIAECGLFEQLEEKCYSKAAEALGAPQLCRSEHCFNKTFQTTLRRGKVPSETICSTSLAADRCSEWFNNSLARASFDISRCSTEYCYSLIVSDIERQKFDRFYLNAIGIENDELKPYFASNFDWDSELAKNIYLDVPISDLIEAIASGVASEKLVVIERMLTPAMKDCGHLMGSAVHSSKKPLRQDCQQTVGSHLARLRGDFTLCGDRHCVSQFIDSEKITSPEQCRLLEPRYTDNNHTESLVTQCDQQLTKKRSLKRDDLL